MLTGNVSNLGALSICTALPAILTCSQCTAPSAATAVPCLHCSWPTGLHTCPLHLPDASALKATICRLAKQNDETHLEQLAHVLITFLEELISWLLVAKQHAKNLNLIVIVEQKLYGKEITFARAMLSTNSNSIIPSCCSTVSWSPEGTRSSWLTCSRHAVVLVQLTWLWMQLTVQ